MVSNMSVLQFPNPNARSVTGKCNRYAVLCRTAQAVGVGILLAILPISAAAQSSSTAQTLQSPPPDDHRGDVSPRREFAISSAGFWAQDLSSEWLLTKHPSLRDARAPVAKGVLAFNALTPSRAGRHGRRGRQERDRCCW
jgi:hypothetical protein